MSVYVLIFIKFISVTRYKRATVFNFTNNIKNAKNKENKIDKNELKILTGT